MKQAESIAMLGHFDEVHRHYESLVLQKSPRADNVLQSLQPLLIVLKSLDKQGIVVSKYQALFAIHKKQ